MRENVSRIDKNIRGAKSGSADMSSDGMSTFKLLQITDCHLGSEPNATLLGMNTDDSLRDVLDTLSRDESPDLLLVTGDISNDAGPISYARFLAIVDTYFPQTPLAWLPGNHDDPDSMLSIGQHPIEQAHSVNGWHLIFLDSRIPRQEGGRLGPRELQRLERELSAHPDTPTAVFLHHQPVPVGSKWIDQYVVEDADAFFEVLDRFPQVKLVSWGHVHQTFSELRNGVRLLATPSTCVQFLPNSDAFNLDTAMPGYRYYGLDANGTFETRVERSDSKVYSVDMTATGY